MNKTLLAIVTLGPLLAGCATPAPGPTPTTTQAEVAVAPTSTATPPPTSTAVPSPTPTITPANPACVRATTEIPERQNPTHFMNSGPPSGCYDGVGDFLNDIGLTWEEFAPGTVITLWTQWPVDSQGVVVYPRPTPIPPSTPTPRPRVLQYEVRLSDPTQDGIDVRLQYPDSPPGGIALSFCAGSWWNSTWPDQRQAILRQIAASDHDGNRLDVTEARDGNTGKYVFRVTAAPHDTITIDYAVNIGFWDESGTIFTQPTRLGAYAAGDYAVIEPGLFLLAPLDLESTVHEVRLKFTLPDGWEVVTFWDKVQDYYVGAPSSLRLTKGPFGFGQFETKEEVVGDTRVIAAAATGVDQPGIVTQRAIDLYKYYRSNVFADVSGYTYTDGPDAPRDGYITIFIPASDAFYNLYHEEYGLYMSLRNQDWDGLAHMLSHNWTEEQLFSNAPWYVTEGFVEYLQVKTTLGLGYISQARYNDHLGYNVRLYHDLLGTHNDRSLASSYYERINRGRQDSHDVDLQYHKGALVGLLLDEILVRTTGGTSDLTDLMQLIFEEAVTLREAQQPRLDSYRIQSLCGSLSSYDFVTFFDLYVRGTQPLPISIVGDAIVVDHAALGL